MQISEVSIIPFYFSFSSFFLTYFTFAFSLSTFSLIHRTQHALSCPVLHPSTEAYLLHPNRSADEAAIARAGRLCGERPERQRRRRSDTGATALGSASRSTSSPVQHTAELHLVVAAGARAPPRQCSSRSASASLLRCRCSTRSASPSPGAQGQKGLGPHAVRRSASKLLFLTSPRAACLSQRVFRGFMGEALLLGPVWLREPENSI